VRGFPSFLSGSAVLALVSIGGAQSPSTGGAQSPSTPVLRVRTEMIVLHVSVRDDDRRPVSDVPCDAFTVYEDGVRQELSVCEPGGAPLTLGLVLDSSTSMGRYRELLAATGEAFVRLGHPENEIFVLLFNEHVRNGLQNAVFTSDAREVAEAVRRAPARGLTAMHDAVDQAIAWASGSGRLKKALVLVSDGGDNASEQSFDEVVRRARQANVSIFAVALRDELDREGDVDALRRLARETGGLVFTPRDPIDIGRAFERIAQDLRSGYTLGYVPTNDGVDGRYRKIRVTARDAESGDALAVRTREGYVM
jgi:Ca-activated chloride channel family protein